MQIAQVRATSKAESELLSRFFLANIICGTSTDVGKTFVTLAIYRRLCASGLTPMLLKPVESGSSAISDAAIFAHEMQLESEKIVSLYRLKEGVSPNIAAFRENIFLDYQKILLFCRHSIDFNLKAKKPIIIESAGGLLTPITNEKTMLDLTEDVKKIYGHLLNTVLVTDSRLGCISHTLACLKCFNFDTVIMNDFPQNSVKNNTSDAIKTIEDFSGHRVILL